MAGVHDSGIIIKMSNLGFRQQLKLEEARQLGTVPESDPKKKKTVSNGLERLKRSPYLTKLQTSPKQRPKLITYKKEMVHHRLPSAYKYFQTVEFRRPSRYDMERMQDYCPIEAHDVDISSEETEVAEI